jgi:hypothetical protein
MPKKLSMELKRMWLEKYDHGETEATIARAERRDLRTVTKGIEQARLERDLSAARTSFLVKSIEAHYGDLLKEAERLIAVIASPTSSAKFEKKPRLMQYVAESRGVSETIFPIRDRERRITEALLEHLGRQWRKRLEDYEELQNGILERAQALQNKLSVEANRRLKKALDYEVDAKGMAASGIAIILFKLQYRQNLVKTDEIIEAYTYRCESGNTKGALALQWGDDLQSYRLVDGLKTEKDKTKVIREHEAILVEALKWDETAALRGLIEQKTKAVEQLQDELETLRLQRILPGHCRYCPGSGAFGAKQQRRAK